MGWQSFDAIYLINLPERRDRKRELERELRGVGLQTDDPRLVWVRAVRPLDAGEFPNIGARGCFLSHLACLRSALERRYKRILILEDDARFPKHRLSDLRNVMEKLEGSNWAIWYGGGNMSQNLSPDSDTTQILPLSYTTGMQTSHCVAFQGDSIGSVRDFLELILTRPNGHPEAGPMHVDGAYSTWRRLNPNAITLVTLPPVCAQRSSQSDIAAPRWFDKAPLLRRGTAVLRRLRNQLNQ
jgi:glycosyl transferase, family 25